jgi:serine/threonine-protein phosphatase 2A regulatory subunit B'
MAGSISKKFLEQYMELFDSEDPRERDYLKTIMHRIYGRFMPLRPYVRAKVQNLVLYITYEKEEHNGLTELLEILSSVINGYAVPLKEEHRIFAKKILIPLHKVRGLQTFNNQLLTCMKNFLEKDKTLGIDLINGLLKYWPITCPAKEVVYINEIEEILETIGAESDKNFNLYGPKLLTRLV